MIKMDSTFGLQQPQWRDIGGQNECQIESSRKYIMWGIKLLLLYSVFSLQWPQWRSIRGQNEGWIEIFFKYIMLGIKLLLLKAQTYLSYLSKCILYLASDDLNAMEGY